MKSIDMLIILTFISKLEGIRELEGFILGAVFWSKLGRIRIWLEVRGSDPDIDQDPFFFLTVGSESGIVLMVGSGSGIVLTVGSGLFFDSVSKWAFYFNSPQQGCGSG